MGELVSVGELHCPTPAWGSEFGESIEEGPISIAVQRQEGGTWVAYTDGGVAEVASQPACLGQSCLYSFEAVWNLLEIVDSFSPVET